jgi:hypothetical protein
MKNKLLRSLIVAMFVMFGALSTAQAEMKCPTEKCDMKMQKEAKNAKCDMNASCPNNAKCTPKMKEKCAMNGKCDAKMKEKCTPKMKQKCADGKCPMQTPEKK